MIILSLICIAIIIKVIIILISGFKSKKNNIDDNDEYSHLENNNTTTTEISEIPKNFDLTVHTELPRLTKFHKLFKFLNLTKLIIKIFINLIVDSIKEHYYSN